MKKKAYLTGMILCFVVCVISVAAIVNHHIQADKASEQFEEMQEIVEDVDEEEKDTENAEEATESPLKRYMELFRENNDLAGWIMIEDTNINYPVMYTPYEKDFYLKKNFEKEYSSHGVPYIAEHCSPSEPSDNLIIYGHHMNDGSMFADLIKYESKKFYEGHKRIRFDTLTETGEYEIICAFKTTVYDEKGFPFYEFARADTEKEFQAYVDSCKSLALYDIGVSAAYGDKLITLSTCEYSQKNGRMVVVAKRVVEPDM